MILGKSLLLAYKINERFFYTSPPPEKNIDGWLSIERPVKTGRKEGQIGLKPHRCSCFKYLPIKLHIQAI
jgi:hypothetical protein